MSQKYKLIFIGGALVLAFTSGRWLAPTKVVTEVKTVEVEKKTDTTKTNTNEHKTTVITTKPDGTSQTVITDDTHTGSKTTDTTSITNTSDTTKEVTRPSSKVTLSALGGVDIHNLSTPIYGVSISKPILGPLTAGAWGLNTGAVGVSIGLSF